MTSLDGATVLVTGANGGLGAEFVRQAIDRGARRVYAAARQPRGWDDERVVPLLLDVTDAADIQEAARSAGDTTVLINNAGIIVPGRILDTAIDEVRSVFESNVFGLVAVSQAFAPLLRNGAILNVASALSWLAIPGSYSASKAAVWAASNTLRLELAEQNTQVLTLHLNYTDTPMTARLTVAKNRPEDVVAAAYDGLEKGANEVLTDETTRHIRAALSAPVEELYPQLSTGV
ncbi:SDR family oxidoreductase [Acidipropionibacterium virtanenii]|uniref:Putative oxidoreductase n=1 Tax=Acidipropionibacterium virtanenii TaxID=2057246 RepID=A0A344UWV3_9ACTN|nr:SDR family oxidoreductase [Acidipropionibacterium virtanenii]AXE39751.1 putative oxidoreductase [Acidipropionibacterium virtanenii]